MIYFEGITGKWRGTYFYVSHASPQNTLGVNFTLDLRQSFPSRLFGVFSGEVEDTEGGMPGLGRIQGGLSLFSGVRFKKYMPVSYLRSERGMISVADLMAGQGVKTDGEIPHPPVHYHGTFCGRDHASGTWVIHPRRIYVNSSTYLPTERSSGTWTLTRQP